MKCQRILLVTLWDCVKRFPLLKIPILKIPRSPFSISRFLAPLKNNRDIETIKCVFKKSSLRFKENQVCVFKESSLCFARIKFAFCRNQVCVSKNQDYVSKNQVLFHRIKFTFQRIRFCFIESSIIA